MPVSRIMLILGLSWEPNIVTSHFCTSFQLGVHWPWKKNNTRYWIQRQKNASLYQRNKSVQNFLLDSKTDYPGNNQRLREENIRYCYERFRKRARTNGIGLATKHEYDHLHKQAKPRSLSLKRLNLTCFEIEYHFFQ